MHAASSRRCQGSQTSRHKQFCTHTSTGGRWLQHRADKAPTTTTTLLALQLRACAYLCSLLAADCAPHGCQVLCNLLRVLARVHCLHVLNLIIPACIG
jgi:hypothetical protein